MHLLVLDGTLPASDIIAELIEGADSVVAADGAALKLGDLGITPDVIIGDLDTISQEEAEGTDGAEVIEDPSQEEYDGEKGLIFLIDSGAEEIVVIGAGGGMIDHVLNNFSLMTRYAQEATIRTVDDLCTGHFVNDRIKIATEEGQRVSIIPMPGAQVTTTGLRWDLDGDVLAWSIREGASNVATGDEVSVAVRNGTVVVFVY